MSSNVDKNDAHLFCDSHSLSISASAGQKRVVDHAVADSVSAVN
jgi:hypothetical protein